jgi:hypothetical protein
MSDLIENIWFTRKARIQASERLSMNGLHAQLILIIYSLANVTFSIAALKYDNFLNGESDIALIIMSVSILVISMYITNIDFKGKSSKFKENYLKLQSLYEVTKTNKTDPAEDYIQLLAECDNHKPIDDKYFRVNNNKSLTSRKPTFFEYIEVILYIIIRKTILILLYLAPLLLPLALK